MVTAILTAMALVLTYKGYDIRRSTLAIGGSFVWVLLGLWCFFQATDKWFNDIYFLIAWFCFGFGIATFIDAAFMKFGVQGSNYVPSEEKSENNDKSEKKETRKERREELGLSETSRKQNERW